MALFQERDPRFRALARHVLLFVLAAPLLIAAVTIAVLIKQDRFKQITDVYFFAPSAYGLATGMAVKLIGFKIGTIEALSLEPDARVKVKLAINGEYMRFLTQSSTARLTKEGLIGQSVIEIEPGADRRRQLAPNGVVQFERSRELGEIAQELYDRITPILGDIKTITAYVNDPEGDVRQTVRNVNRTSAALAETGESLKGLAANANAKLDGLDGRIARVHVRVEQALDQVNTGLSGATRSIDTVNERLPGILLKVEGSLERVQSTLADLKRVTEAAAEEGPAAIRDGRALMQDGRTIVDGVKQAWPVRELLPKPEARTIPLDSHEALGPRHP